jgi:hypothetical protein
MLFSAKASEGKAAAAIVPVMPVFKNFLLLSVVWFFFL